MNVYNIYKKLGQTPLEALELFRKRHKISSAAKLTYAGRLDPMASGVLLILQGATQEQREKYMGLYKVYKAKVLFGFGTDTFDILGLPSQGNIKDFTKEDILKILQSLHGKAEILIPQYSSVLYKGRPLFMSAREDKINNKNWPKREMEIKKINFLKLSKISYADFLKLIELRIKKVKGDFRQERILTAWRKILNKKKISCQVIELEISCGSGTYIRSIANEIGMKLGTKAVLLNLERLSVGKYSVKKSIKI